MGGTGVTETSSATTATTATTTEASSSGAGRSSPRTKQQRARSVVEDQGVYNSTCGYCKSPSRSSVAQGLWAYSLTVQDYQDLLDRGWRRSGMFLYKPRMMKTCCPPYTIRLKAESFVATKDQSRVLRRMQRYLDGKLRGLQTVGNLQKENDGTSERVMGLQSDNQLASVSDRNASRSESLRANSHPSDKKEALDSPPTEEEKVLSRLQDAVSTALVCCVQRGLLPLKLDVPTVVVKRIPQRVKDKLKNAEGEVDFTSNIAFAVMAGLKRRSKSDIECDENLKEQQGVIGEMKPQEIAELLVGKMSELGDLHGVTVKASKGHINIVLPGSNLVSSGHCSKDTGVPYSGNEKKSGVSSMKQPSSFMQSSIQPSSIVGILEVRMKRSTFDAEEFALYKKYQVRVHNDRPEDVKEGSYRRFLVDSPLIFVPPGDDGTTPSCGFGSFHQQYLIDGKLVAVGVVDVLPYCLSSKYLFWDPDFAFLALGKYSALQEIKWVQEVQKVCSSLQYYYLGFYIHSCPKMRYKAAYYPSELLCPERFRWVAYELAVPFLEKQSYVCLSDIACLQSTSVESSNPEIGSAQMMETTSDVDTEEDDSAMEIEADFSHSEDLEKLDTTLEVVLEKNVTQRVSDLMGPLGTIQLYINGGCLSFKQLQEFALIPQWHLDTLVRNLNRYLQVVGPSLASRMAYALS